MHSSRKFTSSVLFVVTIAIVVALFGETRSWASTHYGGGGYADINEGTCNRSTAGSEVLGGALGAIIGGLLGSQVGRGKGKLAATAIGVLVGALAGSAISKNMDQADNDCISKILEAAPDKQAVAWRNPDARADYRVTPLRTYRMAGNQCREYITKVVIDGKAQQDRGTACRQPNGSWKLVDNVTLQEPPIRRAPPVLIESRTSPDPPPPLTEEERERRKIIESLTYGLETKNTCSVKPTWSDKGSGADLDGFFFDPNVPDSYFPIGGYGSQNRAGRHCVTVVHTSPNNPKGAPQLLALPTGWNLIWKDTGSGADLDGSMWEPVPPSKEFICIGSVSQIGYTRPTVPHYRCVHNSLVEEVSLTTVIWSDKGSGADKEVTIFKLPVSGSFVAVQGRRNRFRWFDLRHDTAIRPPREVVETKLSKRMAFIRKERKIAERKSRRRVEARRKALLELPSNQGAVAKLFKGDSRDIVFLINTASKNVVKDLHGKFEIISEKATACTVKPTKIDSSTRFGRESYQELKIKAGVIFKFIKCRNLLSEKSEIIAFTRGISTNALPSSLEKLIKYTNGGRYNVYHTGDHKAFARKVLSERRAARARAQAPKRAGPPPAPAPLVQPPLTADEDTQPPVIDVPGVLATKTAAVEIAGRVTDSSRIVEVTMDGQPVEVEADGSFSTRRGVPTGESTITIAALDEWGNRAERSVTVTRDAVVTQGPIKVPAEPPVAPKPNPYAGIQFGAYHALVIGNNKYRDLTNLKTAVKDARAVAKLLTEDYGFDTKLLIDATRGDVMGAMAGMREKLKADDNLLIYYAGHGTVDSITEQGYWLPVDAEEAVPTNWVSNNDITTMLKAIQAKHIMVVADSCYSGTLVREAAAKMKTARERTAWFKLIVKKRGRTALVSGGLEPVADSGKEGHSVFANAFLAALRENRDVIDGQGLYDAIKGPVVVNAKQTPQYSNIRFVGHDGGDFVFVRR